MDPTLSLDEFAHHASRYSINLNGLIEKDPTFNPVLGGQAKVYRGTIRYQMEDGPAPGNATTVPCETQVAIKTVRYLPQNQTAITRALQEVHLWSKLRHDNVLELLGIVTDFEETVSIISVWMPKGNAREYVQDRAVDPRPFVLDIAKGLEYLHAHKPGPIYHGDLKGANVLIARDGRALLTDFGFSYLSESSFSIALPDHMGGTLRYMAPERLDNSAPSAKGDVWAFGMTVLEKQLHSDEESIPSEETDVDSSCATLLDESNLYSAKEKDPYYRIPDDVGSLSMSSTLGERALHSRPRIPITPSEISPDDTVILFMGSTASGMSNFINKLTGMPEEPDAGSLASRTRNIEAYSYDHANGRFIFVDTPGFNSTDGALPDAVLNVVARWLEQYAKSFLHTLFRFVYDGIDATEKFRSLALFTLGE
ncbi:hypothetical protein ID866_8503 [Astraeus odoratus]|nr:hypothetical protein ID866_8503 [Astraeus odoratus]